MSDYNGWSNKETWLVMVWFADTLYTDKENGVTITQDYIETMVEDSITNTVKLGTIAADLVAMAEIDYQALAAHFAD